MKRRTKSLKRRQAEAFYHRMGKPTSVVQGGVYDELLASYRSSFFMFVSGVWRFFSRVLAP